ADVVTLLLENPRQTSARGGVFGVTREVRAVGTRGFQEITASRELRRLRQGIVVSLAAIDSWSGCGIGECRPRRTTLALHRHIRGSVARATIVASLRAFHALLRPLHLTSKPGKSR